MDDRVPELPPVVALATGVLVTAGVVVPAPGVAVGTLGLSKQPATKTAAKIAKTNRMHP
jgi:hypothetical protein